MKPRPTTAALATSSPGLDTGTKLRWLGMVLILAPLLVRATASTTTLPAWDLDPTVFAFSTPALGPAGSLLIDGLVLLGAAAVFAAEWMAKRRVSSLAIVLVAIGSIACLAHVWLLPSPDSSLITGSLGNRRIGLAWMSGIWAAVAVAHAARDIAVRKLITAVVLAFVVTLAARGVQQVLIEHPASVAAYRADPDKFRAARGWPEGSSMAKSYERRLAQPEATGWFGLANVYASFAVFGVVASAGLLKSRWRSTRSLWAEALLVIGVLTITILLGTHFLTTLLVAIFGKSTLAAVLINLLIAGIGLWLVNHYANGQVERAARLAALAGSLIAMLLCNAKGGYAAAVLGLALLFVSRPFSRLAALRPALARRIGPLLGIGCIVGVVAAIMIRGLIGERIGELSILFRSFYLEAAVRIFAGHPFTGVGPDGFQQAYLLAKNPLSPEEVTSPHSILFDWMATLGIAGAAWCVLMLGVAVRAGFVIGGTSADPSPPETSSKTTASASTAKVAMLILAIATIGAAWVDSPYITLDAAAVRVGSLVLGCVLCAGLCRERRGGVDDENAARVALGAGALALLAHGQLDVTFSNVAAAGLAMIACVGFGPLRTVSASTRGAGAVLATSIAMVMGMVCMVGGALPAHRWERELKAGAAEARVIAELQDEISALSAPPTTQPSTQRPDPAAVLRRISEEAGRTVAPSNQAVAQAMLDIERKRLVVAAEHLRKAALIFSSEWRVRREESRLHLRLAYGFLATSQPREAANAAAAATAAIQPPFTSDGPVASAPWFRALAVAEEAYGLQADDREYLVRAVASLDRAVALDPYNLDIAVRLWRLNTRIGQADAAKQWAKRALELDDLVRLDKDVRGLSKTDRAEIEMAAQDKR